MKTTICLFILLWSFVSSCQETKNTTKIPIQAINCDQGFRFYEEENVRVYNSSCDSTLNLLDSLFISNILNVETFSRSLVEEITSEINSIDTRSNYDYNFTGFCISLADFHIKNDTDDYSEFDFCVLSSSGPCYYYSLRLKKNRKVQSNSGSEFNKVLGVKYLGLEL